MQLKQLNFIHFFMSEKEYLLEVDTISSVSISKGSITIFFKGTNNIPPVTEFFVKYAEDEILFFFGNNDVKYDSPVVSRTGYYASSGIKNETTFYLEFNIKDI